MALLAICGPEALQAGWCFALVRARLFLMRATLLTHWQHAATTVDTRVMQASALGQARTFSSHCSGFGSAEIALGFLNVGLAFAGWHGLAIRSSSACAGCPVIQTACASLGPALIPRMWTPGAWHLWQQSFTNGHSNHIFGDLFGMLASSTMLARPAWCYGHSKVCQPATADLDVTGTPCQDFAPNGHRQ